MELRGAREGPDRPSVQPASRPRGPPQHDGHRGRSRAHSQGHIPSHACQVPCLRTSSQTLGELQKRPKG